MSTPKAEGEVAALRRIGATCIAAWAGYNGYSPVSDAYRAAFVDSGGHEDTMKTSSCGGGASAAGRGVFRTCSSKSLQRHGRTVVVVGCQTMVKNVRTSNLRQA